jgi:hypothetical protein
MVSGSIGGNARRASDARSTPGRNRRISAKSSSQSIFAPAGQSCAAYQSRADLIAASAAS